MAILRPVSKLIKSPFNGHVVQGATPEEVADDRYPPSSGVRLGSFYDILSAASPGHSDEILVEFLTNQQADLGEGNAYESPSNQSEDPLVIEMFDGDFDESTDALEDPSLTEAALASIASSSLTPLVKEELKCLVQVRRHLSGKETTLTEEERSAKNLVPYQPTAEDLKRRERRKLSNKMSARRCRDLKKSREEQLEKEVKTISEDNNRLLKEISELRILRNRMKVVLEEHQRTCSRKTTGSLAQSVLPSCTQN